MSDIDFDELDRAVRAVMNESVDTTPKPVTKVSVTPAPAPAATPAPVSAATSVPVPDPKIASPSDVQSSVKSRGAMDITRPLVGGSKDSFKPQSRNRLFMDVKPTATKSAVGTSPDPLMDLSAPVKRPSRRSAAVKPASPVEPVTSQSPGVRKPAVVAPAPWESKGGSSDIAAGSDMTKSEGPKEPFEDVFASLKSEIDSFKLESDTSLDVKSQASPEVLTPVKLDAHVADTSSQTPEAPSASIDESNSFSPFLSSVAVDKRPLGVYSQSLETADASDTDIMSADASLGASQVESEAKIDSASASSSAKPEVGTLYGVDPLEGVEFEDVDGALVSSGEVDGNLVGSPVSSDDDPLKTDGEDTVGDLGSRIARELSGEDTSDESVDKVVIQSASSPEGAATKSESSTAIDEEFHKEAPIHLDSEVVPDFDVEFKEVEIADPNDEIVTRSLAKIDKMTREKALADAAAPATESSTETAIEVRDVAAPKETPAPKAPVEEEVTPAPREIKLAGVTVGPDDTHVSVEDVAVMEESIAGRTEEPEKAKKRQPRRSRVISEFKQRKEAPVKEASAILKEGGPTAINQQYKQPTAPAKDGTEHKTFNTDSFAMPVGTKSSNKIGVSVKGVILVAIAAILVGVVSAFGLFYSGLI